MKINYNGNIVNLKDKISVLESKFGFTFPDDYKDFLFKSNGGIVNPEYKIKIQIPTTDSIVTLKMFYGFSTNRYEDLSFVNRRFLRINDAKVFAIAFTYENGFFVINNSDDDQIYYWDSDIKMEESTSDGNAYLVAKNFSEFVNMIELSTIKKEKGENNMETRNYLPLGSIVKLKGGISKLLITSRGIIINHKEEDFFFDYAGVIYPEGLLSDEVIYFNSDSISNVIFEGYSDEDDKVVVGNINNYIQNHPDLVWGDAENWDKE